MPDKKKVKKTSRLPAAVYRLGDDVVQNTSHNILIYGVNGVGKTPFWGSGKDVLIMDSDHGVASARSTGSKAHVWPVTDYDSLEQCYQFVANEKHDFRWVVWDSATQFQDRALVDDILVDAHLTNSNQSVDVASQREYLVSQNRIGRYVRQFVALPINFGISCHVGIDDDTDSQSGELMYVPALQGRGKVPMWSRVCGYMDVIGYMHKAQIKGADDKKKTIRRIMFQGDATHIARDRTATLGRYLNNPTLPEVERLINGSKTIKKKEK